ncbi:DUF2057 family protein [Vibrio fluvialis]|uniref:DUF2057 family protein n=1 Tax=Vibrio fluvialis TaxID=676 RepID=UPI00192BE428|nr:DUF2057 family protein [Vibrio fluvialis]MBL4248053.1 DUF2057 family protein [Vibrio fluvialis]MBL4256822.1 DUF2057 family protein [Vibrio fluvialis]
MKYISANICIFCTLIFASVNAQAKVILEIPEFVDLKVVNMSKPKLIGGLLDSVKTVELPNGTNQILFQYNPTFLSKDKIDRVHSELIIAKFEATDDTISFVLPRFKNPFEAKRSISSLDWQMKNSFGAELAKKEDILRIEGIRIGRDYTQDMEEYNKDGGVASVSLTYVTVNNSDSRFANQEITKSIDDKSSTTLDKLKKLYFEAPIKDRKEFQKWIVDQN